MVGAVEVGRRQVSVEILVPEEGWPSARDLADLVRAELSAPRAERGRNRMWTCGS
jgi:hypothetical protein